MGKLSVRGIDGLRDKPGMHADGEGLYLNVTASGTRSWILRVMVAGKRTDRGLGGYSTVSLAEARDHARTLRALLRAGRDPKLEAKPKTKAVTFAEAGAACIEAKRAGWRNAKHAEQWSSTLETYAYPVIGAKSVADVDWPDVLRVLTPIWSTKAETARRLRARLEAVIDYATAREWRTDGLANPAARSAKFKHALPDIPRRMIGVAGRRGHQRAMPWAEVPAFVRDLQSREGVGARALEFLVLSACRSGEVRLMTHEEIKGDVWVIPASRMKAGREHRVPLTPRMLELIGQGKGLVFPGRGKGKPLSDMSLAAVLKRMHPDNKQTPVPHGFRSSFRDWVAEATSFPGELAEKALAHVLPSQTERAYQRADMIAKRRDLMAAWEGFVLNRAETVLSLVAA